VLFALNEDVYKLINLVKKSFSFKQRVKLRRYVKSTCASMNSIERGTVYGVSRIGASKVNSGKFRKINVIPGDWASTDSPSFERLAHSRPFLKQNKRGLLYQKHIGEGGPKGWFTVLVTALGNVLGETGPLRPFCYAAQSEIVSTLRVSRMATALNLPRSYISYT
jgi:hypothetical protein